MKSRKTRGSRSSSSPARTSPSFSRLTPDPGPWSLDWSLADRGGPFPWPDLRDSLYQELAGFLARLNEMSLDAVMEVERANQKSAVHALTPETLSEPASERLSELYSEKGLDEGGYGDLEIITMTYCLAQYDSRRVVVALDGPARRMYPLWWDPDHGVSGSDGRTSEASPCSSDVCFHSPAS